MSALTALTSRTLPALLAGGLVLASAAPAAAEPEPGTTKGAAVAVTALPFSASDAGPMQTAAATDAADQAVARGCNEGAAVSAPRWWSYTPSRTVQVVAQSSAAYAFGRDTMEMPTGTAVLSAAGAVLACSTDARVSSAGAVKVAAGERVSVVSFFPAPLECDECPYDGWQRSVALREVGAAPINDAWANATPVTALPFRATVDTTLATAQPVDSTISECAAPGGGYRGAHYSTWYRFTPTTSGPLDIRVDGVQVGQEGGSRVAAVATLTADGPRFVERCDDEQAYPGSFTAGTTYLLMVADFVPTYSAFGVGGGPRTVEITGALPLAKHDLVVTGLSWSPSTPAAGAPVRFSATIKNVGRAATPGGVVHGVAFRVDGRTVTWSDTHTASLAPGASVTLSANGGRTSSTWTAVAGAHTITAYVDDVNRMPGEGSETNNTRSRSLTVA